MDEKLYEKRICGVIVVFNEDDFTEHDEDEMTYMFKSVQINILKKIKNKSSDDINLLIKKLDKERNKALFGK